MKKLLSILGVCEIVSMSANLTACDKPNNNENGGSNKPESKPEKPQEPPIGSNWKLIIDWKDEEKNPGKTYIGIWGNKPDYKIIDWKADPSQPKCPLYHFKVVYRWDGNGEPEIPEFDNKTGKITDWKE